MKKLLILVLVLAAIYGAVKLSIKSPDKSIPLATEETAGINGTPTDSPTPAPIDNSTDIVEEKFTPDRITAEYTGYGPGGKVETGSVKASASTLVRKENAFSGGVTFDMSTITSVPVKDKLITHLKSTDFFDVAKYPTATFTITSATDKEVKGNLTMKGITKALTLPFTADAATGAYTSTVRVNMEDFGIKQTFTDKEFVLKITVK